MRTYLDIAVRYLKLNKKRSIVTIVAVTLAVAVLYMLLNLGWCEELNYREQLREEENYEIVFLTETKEEIEAIMADSLVKDASVGSYRTCHLEEDKTYTNALFVNTTNPYWMCAIQKKLNNTYNVESELNDLLAATYFQGENNTSLILCLALLLFSFIFAIFGIGVVRNSIQMSALEQIKDYGNLRCIGASKKQLRHIIYLEGLVLELTGNIIGFGVGYLFCIVIGHKLEMEIDFHLLPMLPVLVAFLGDLYFAMQENCKLVVKVSPIGALRGELRIRQGKLKIRKRNLFSVVFGVEGDYAYKNVMRNPGRFYKTVWALGLGMTLFIALMTMVKVMYAEKERMFGWAGYYQVYFENRLEATDSKDEAKISLPSSDDMKRIRELDGVTEAKRVYSSYIRLADIEENYAHYSKQFLTKTLDGECLAEYYERMKEDEEKNQESDNYTMLSLSEAICYGYDEEEYQGYEDVLEEGTLDVSENGIVLVKSGRTFSTAEESMTDIMVGSQLQVDYSDYQIGDQIKIIDMAKYRELVLREMEAIKSDYTREIAEAREGLEQDLKAEEYGTRSKKYYALVDEYNDKKREILEKNRKQLFQEGAYKTYTIEGIVSEDVNHNSTSSLTFLLPIKNYYAISGTDETYFSGMKYHIEKDAPASVYEQIYSVDYDGAQCYCSEYCSLMLSIYGMKDIAIGVLLVIIFFVAMVSFNIINTTASGIYLRKKEFAQLRVVGVSKKRLLKMVILEGIIQSLAASLIGIVLGYGMCRIFLRKIILLVFGLEVGFPVLGAIVGVIVSTLILCGSIYVPIREMKMNMAQDLAASGE